jgi:hypothetical protein
MYTAVIDMQRSQIKMDAKSCDKPLLSNNDKNK